MKKEDYMIAIITRGRVDTQIFLESLPDLIKKLITIVCHPGEKNKHRKRWGDSVNDIIEYGSDCCNVGQARHWLMNYCRKIGVKQVIQFDDNVIIGCRATLNGEINWENKLLTIRNNYNTDVQISIYVQLFSWLLNYLRYENYAMTGICHRSGNNFQKFPLEENTRLFACFAVDVDKYFETGKYFSDIELKEDFYIELSFLTSGYKIIRSNLFTFDKAKGANQSGGCSTYRKLDNMNQTSEELKKKFPDFVNIVEKDSGNWNGIENLKRKEVIVKWKKAYESSKKHC